ncbi:hypothetical protein BOX15_Mlig014545g2 [Macrostomum lignano]|uniref:protein-disulfide reductase n=2 Tax=Macrostomum lignano TaxID=282301 RepID=A0A1I8GLE2_9PLAT|nr:hypothetical protein BOX15_Mlig014545g1 [Macrostomum lignano]PAA74132.1 hypothetical protein BOX15_Mlig014545g2 [Macrostomum lignano]
MSAKITPLSLTVQDKARNVHKGSDVFKGKKIMLYFSAHWCPPCRTFTPALALFYEEAKASHPNLECVFVSCDRDEASMLSYFNESHGDYYVLPFNSEERTGLAKQYQVSGIPCLIVVDEEGKVLKPNAREDVQKGNFAAINQW